MISPDAAPLTSGAPTTPNISLVPPPTLEEQLAKALAERDAAQRFIEGQKKDIASLTKRVEAHESNTFSFMLANLDYGQTLADSGKGLQELIEAVRNLNAKGRFRLEIEVRPVKGQTALVFIPDVKISAPKQDPKQSIFFPLGDGKLSRNDPKQRELPLGGDGQRMTREDRAEAYQADHPEYR